MQRERQRHRQREKQPTCGEPHARLDPDPGPEDHALSWRQTHSTAEPPRHTIIWPSKELADMHVRLSSLKSSGQVGDWKPREGLMLQSWVNPEGRGAKNLNQDFLHCSFENYFSFGKPKSLPWRPSTNWLIFTMDCLLSTVFTPPTGKKCYYFCVETDL